MTFRLQGRRALVTGASSGIGRDIAVELARRGCDLVVVARRQERLLEVKRDIETRFGRDVRILTADLADSGAPLAIFNACEEAGLAIDVLVNNAGYGLKGAFLDLPLEQHQDLVSVDIASVVELTHRFLPAMVARGSGRVLFIASTMAYQAAPAWAAYSGAKGFILLFGESLAFELRGTGVAATVVSPGNTATEFHDRSGQKVSLFQRLTTMSSEDVARAAVRAMIRGTPSTIPGFVNAMVINSNRLVPRRFATAATALAMRLGSAK